MRSWLTKKILVTLIAICAILIAQIRDAASQTTKILDNGMDGAKLVFAVLGDGYAAADQAKYRVDVDRLVINGLLEHDFYKMNRSAFNVYRVDLISKESGVSTLTTPKDTALKMIYSGDWNRCWMEESSDTGTRINNALSSVPKYDYVLVILNENGWGGCARGIRLSVTSGIDWDTVAHEYGHGIGSLEDEYWIAGTTYTGLPVNSRNVSSILDRNRVVWHKLISPNTPVPTTAGPGIDPNRTVGMFEGAQYKEKRIYRPVDRCRMNSNTPPFCPVCTPLLQTAVDPYVGHSVTPINMMQSDRNSPGRRKDPKRSATHRAVNNQIKRNDKTIAFKPGNKPAQQAHYLHLVVQVTRDGKTSVLRATELPGAVILRDRPTGDYAYELATNERPLVAEALLSDPFVERSIPDQAGEKGHHFGHANSAVIVVKVPNMTIKDLTKGSLNLRLFKIEPNAAVDKINASTIKMLAASQKLKVEFNVSGNELRKQVIERFNSDSQKLKP